MTKNDIRTVLSPLLIINYVLGLRIVEFPKGRSRLWLSLLYILLLWSVYYYLYTTVMYFINLYEVFSRICQWLNNSIILLSIIVGIYHDKKFRYCLKKLAIVDVTLEKLGIIINYNRQEYIKIVWLVLGWFVTATLINCVHILFMKYEHNYNIATIIYISIIINYCSHINLIEDLIISSILGYIGLKFDQINKHLQNLTNNNKQAIKRVWENSFNSPQCTLPKIPSSKRIIWIVMHLHLELCKISREIDLIFGIQMTFKMGCYFGFMTINLYELFNIIFKKDVTNNSNIFTCIHLIWFSHNVLKILLVNYMCEKVYTKANATKAFANRVLCSTMCDVEINENISQLLLQMAQSPLRFYGLGLFQFGFKFLYGFTTSVTTVVVILIQAHTAN